MKKEIIAATEDYVRKLLKKLPAYLTYHNLHHTVEVVDSVVKIADSCHLIDSCHLTDDEKEILILAAWFHDTGFVETYKGHEKVSKQIATTFLKSQKYPGEKIKMVRRCIDATKINYQPTNLLENIIRDADLYHLATADYFKKLASLKKEWEYVYKTKITDQSWYTKNLDFLTAHRYHTPYCQHQLKVQKQENVFKNLQKVATYKCSI